MFFEKVSEAETLETWIDWRKMRPEPGGYVVFWQMVWREFQLKEWSDWY